MKIIKQNNGFLTDADTLSRMGFLRLIEEGNYNEIERIILEGSIGSLNLPFDQNGKKHTYMELAAIAGHINIVRLLKAHGADINGVVAGGYLTPLAMAIYAQHLPDSLRFIQQMIAEGANPHLELSKLPDNTPNILLLNPAENAIFALPRIDVLHLFLQKKYITPGNAFYYALCFRMKILWTFSLNRA